MHILTRLVSRHSLCRSLSLYPSRRAMASDTTTIPHTLPLPGGIPDTHRPHTESTTTILVHKDNTAFLNPVQQYNRDLSIACIRGWNDLRKEEAEAKWRRKRENKLKKEKESESKGNGVGEIKEGEAGPSTERAFRAPKFTILEALSATGLRSIRYAKEIPDVRYVLANDLSESACEAMKMNVALNGVDQPITRSASSTDAPVEASGAGSVLTEMTTVEEATANAVLTEDEQMERVGRRDGCTGVVKINEGDACALMYSRRHPSQRVDVVDLDPYGSASPFIDSAIGCIADGGLLCVTCTDLAVLAGSQYPEKAYSQYGGASVNAEYSHEVALRLVLHSLAIAAARYGRHITPLLSFSIDFYVRLFVRIDSGATKVKELASQVGTVYVCNYCQTPTEQRLGKVVEREDKNRNTQKSFKAAAASVGLEKECGYCGGTLHVGGPMWLGPIQDPSFADRVLKGIEGDKDKYGTWQRMRGMLTVAGQELDTPFYFTTNRLHGLFHASSGSTTNSISALLNAGYRVSRSHAAQGSLKTDAPRQFLFDMVREYAKKMPVRVDRISETSPARRLNDGEQQYKVDFTPHPQAKALERGDNVFYQVNPTANWGPGTKAKTVKTAPAAASGKSKKRKVEDVKVGSVEVDKSDHVEQELIEAKRVKVDDVAGDEESALNV